MKPKVQTKEEAITICQHCGDTCPPTEVVVANDHSFCCTGCQLVYSLLQENDLLHYYAVEGRPGINTRSRQTSDYRFLDDTNIVAQLLDYEDKHRHQLRLHLPQIHCAACVWLLENIYRLLPGILSSRVNIVQRTAKIAYDPQQLRPGIENLLSTLRQHYNLYLLSGDQDREAKRYGAFFSPEHLHFKQQPQDKLNFINTEREHCQVMRRAHHET